jgi:hypothetical protein
MLVSSIVMEINILLIDQILDHFVRHLYLHCEVGTEFLCIF